MSQALNVGIQHARGEWIVRMDDDDIMHPLRIARTLEAIQTAPPNAFLIAGLAKTFQRSGKNISVCIDNKQGDQSKIPNLHRVNPSILLLTTPFFHPAICFRKTQICYDPLYHYAQDLKFYIDNISSGSFWIDKRTYLYYQIPSGSSWKRKYQLAFHDRAIHSLHKRIDPSFSLVDSSTIRSLFVTAEYPSSLLNYHSKNSLVKDYKNRLQKLISHFENYLNEQ